MGISMVSLRVKPSRLEGSVVAPPSKSYTHRALAVALLARGKSEVLNPLRSSDTEATMEAVKTFGGRLDEVEGGLRVKGTGGRLEPKSNLIHVGNSGTTLRFFSAIAALSPKPVGLTGDRSILARPMGPLVEALNQLGARARCEGPRGRPPVVVEGRLRGGEAELDAGLSSQFLSALLLACPYAEEEVELHVVGLRSKPYVEITLEVLEEAGARVKRDKELTEFRIPGRQVFCPSKFKIPGDFSSAAFLLAAGALAGEGVRVKNLDLKTSQGDKRVVYLLREFGAEVRVSRDWVEVSKGELEGLEVDCGDTPDLVPVLAVLGAAADGRTTLLNIPHLRYKETDRLRALRLELSKLGARVKELPGELRVEGARELRGARVSSHGDHRMAMALAVAGLAARGETVVEGAECVRISYPDFTSHLQKLGARVELA